MTYPTRKFKCWDKAKEDRAKQFKDFMTARERGLPVIIGGSGYSMLLTGFGDCGYLPGEAYGAEVSRHPGFFERCVEAVEHKGFASDLCGYLRNYWGSVFIGETPWGKFPKPDVVIQGHHCDSHGKWFRQLADHFGVPYFVVDYPEKANYRVITEQQKDYQVAQYIELIEWLEKQLNRTYDDEALIEGVVNSRKTGAYWAEICVLNQAVPAPMDIKSMFALVNPAVRTKYLAPTVEFYHELRDEMIERVRDGIAAVANERKRLIHDNLPPWFAMHIFRYMEQYGVVCIGSQYQFGWGHWHYDEKGRFYAKHITEVEQEPRPRTREEALRLMVSEAPLGGLAGDSGRFITEQIYDDWKCDGAIFHMNRGCEGWTRGKMEARLALHEKGVPTMVYEGNGSDKRDFNEPQVLSRMQAFFESMGLARIAG